MKVCSAVVCPSEFPPVWSLFGKAWMSFPSLSATLHCTPHGTQKCLLIDIFWCPPLRHDSFLLLLLCLTFTRSPFVQSLFMLNMLPSPCKVKLRQIKMQNLSNVILNNLTFPLHAIFLFYSQKGQIFHFNQGWDTTLLESGGNIAVFELRTGRERRCLWLDMCRENPWVSN